MQESEMEESSWATGSLHVSSSQLKKQPTLKTREWRSTFITPCEEDTRGQILHYYSGEMPQTSVE